MADWDLYMMPREFTKGVKPLWSRNCERHLKEEIERLENG